MLKVAYFGSEYFSITCLRQILPLCISRNSIIKQLDVIARSPKLSGRGMNRLKDVPIASFARENDLNLLRADSKDDFKRLSLQNYDLCIAVSYGKLIPSSFLTSVKHGGLNVHPSLLPKYSGPAPLSRALLNNDKITGVTVQTLHPTEFDKGDILKFEKYEISPEETYDSLSQTLAVKGGNLLNEIITKKIYDRTSSTHQILQPVLPFSYANKIKSAERMIDWQKYSTFDLMRREGTLGKLYTFKNFTPKKKQKKLQEANAKHYKRVILASIKPSELPHSTEQLELAPGSFFQNENDDLEVKTLDGFVVVGEVKVEGFGSEDGARFFGSFKKKFGNLETKFATIDENLKI